MKVAIVGNSHLGCLNQALESGSVPVEENIDLVFWGAAGTDFPLIRYEQGILKSPRPRYSLLVSGGRYDDLPVRDFDVIVFYASQIDPFRFARRLAPLFEPGRGFSAAFERQALAESLGNWWSGLPVASLIGNIGREFPETRLLVYPTPYWSPNCGLFPESYQRQLMMETIAKVTNHAAQRIAEHGGEFRRQPLETIEAGIFTRMDLSKGSIKNVSGGVPHDDTDHVHMNRDYGLIVIHDIIDALTQGQASRCSNQKRAI